MQLRFAYIHLHNDDLALRYRVMVGYFNGNWAAQRVARHDNINLLFTDVDGPMEERIADATHGRGTVKERGKPFIEISMLLKRHIRWGTSAWGNAGSTARVEKIEEVSWNELIRGLHASPEAGGRAALLAVVMRLLLIARHPVSAERAEAIRERISNVLHNAYYGAALQNAASFIPSRGYCGLLAARPGSQWRNEVNVYPDPRFRLRKQWLKMVGQFLGRCIARATAHEPYGDDLEDLKEVLTDHSNMDQYLWPVANEKINALLTGVSNLLRLQSCGHFEMQDRTHIIRQDGVARRWCESCFENDAVLVVDLNEHWPRDNAFFSDSRDEYYSYDIDAEDEENAPEYEDTTSSILDYSTNVMRILRADARIRSSPYGEFLMGIELELTTATGGSRATVAKAIRKELGAEYCVIKNDGSLPMDGLELVTAPRGLVEHVAKFTNWTIDPRWRAWDTNQCGLHVHLHSRAFTEMTLGKFLMFINLDTNAVFLRKLAGRHPLKDSWAARFCAHEGSEILENPKAAIKGKSRERYRMVNTQNLTRGEAERLGLDPFSYSGKYDTVELRVFKASLKRERLLAQIEFAHASVMFCRVASYQDLSSKSFLQWLASNAKMYPNLSNWYGTRKSKALKDCGVASLENICSDSVASDMVVPARAVRATRPRAPLTGLNQYLTPRERREAQERELRERLSAANSSLAEAQNQALALLRREQEALRVSRGTGTATTATVRTSNTI